MLKLEDIRYPITFHSIGVGSVTFTSPTDGIYTYGRMKGESTSSHVSYYINMHNYHYHKNGDYAYDMPAKPDNELERSAKAIRDIARNSKSSGLKIDESGFSILNQKDAHQFGVFMSSNFADNLRYKNNMESSCKIEDMPIGAQLLAVNIGERWVDTKIIADTIAINGNEFVLTKKTGEVSSLSVCIKRGMIVKYKI